MVRQEHSDEHERAGAPRIAVAHARRRRILGDVRKPIWTFVALLVARSP
jgi:hypothetical protein